MKKIMAAIGRFAHYRKAERRRDENERFAHPRRSSPLQTKSSAENNSLAENKKRTRDLPAGHGETILIVDDESTIREVTKAVLPRAGYNTLVADDGPSALAIFVERWAEIDVVVTDLVMLAVSGSLLVQVLHRMTSKPKVIICSGQCVDDMPVQLTTIGVQAYLTKPYTHETLLRTVDRVLHELF
jgi:two-component system, cell cycle sensor histidine kinase and response regulator CckA